jgi:cysteine-rich repeat protein
MMSSFTITRLVLFAVLIACLISASTLLQQDAKLVPSVAAAELGYSSSISGNVALVGAYGVNSNKGAAYIFRSSDGRATWPSSETQKLTASDGVASDKFGWSVSISGNVSLVGAPFATVGGKSQRGAAYIFRSPDGGTTWPSGETQKLTASDGNTDSMLGRSVSISGDIALAGAWLHDFSGIIDPGAAYVFRSPNGGTTWPSQETQKLTASDAGKNYHLGYSCFVSGNIALVGAIKSHVGSTDQGAVYVFRSSDGGTTWPSSETQKLTASDGASVDWFGNSVSFSGNISLVGARRADIGSNSYQGAAYIFRSPDGGATWPSSSETQKLTASDGAAGDALGWSVSISGNVALVGANAADVGGNSNQGAAYIFRSPDGGTTWPSSETQKLTASDGNTGYFLGRSVSISRDVALVGASGQGAAYIFSPYCGNGIIQSGESCDDKNQNNTDGCNSTCGIETGWTCSGQPSHCDGMNGDGLIRGTEECDDSNLYNNDGCNSTCGIETGWTCSGQPSHCDGMNGDGLIRGTEECDDGNLSDSDGCNSTCGIETGWTCSGQPSHCDSMNGDGLIRGTEECDDSNLYNNDGCNSTCGIETGWTCSGQPSHCDSMNGDGLIRGTEKCDDSNLYNNDGCNSTCGIETGWTCSGQPSHCDGMNGDGLIRGTEKCDDSNLYNNDGCNSTCGIETGWTCSGQPSICQKCFNGIVEGTETCDDNNGVNNDGCNSTCGIETGWTCSGQPSHCDGMNGDGLIRGTEECDDGNLYNNDGCSETCLIEDGWTCSGEPSVCAKLLAPNPGSTAAASGGGIC